MTKNSNNEVCQERFSLLSKGKGCCPFDYLSEDISRYEEKRLPDYDKFYSCLTQKLPSRELYNSAVSFFDTFHVGNEWLFIEQLVNQKILNSSYAITYPC